MHLSKKQCTNWRETIDQALPDLLRITAESPGQSLVIGASVLHVYYEAGWIARARSTGDVDLSIGLVASKNEYESVRSRLVDAGYKPSDPDRHYRLFSPARLSLEVSYVDLLAHPQGSVSNHEALSAMGVGDAWSFDAILFALESAFCVTTNVHIPNPIGFLALKHASFVDDPQRVKDIVDVLDVVFGLVGKGLHYDLNSIWQMMRKANPIQANLVMNMIGGLADERVEWNLQRAEQEYVARGYSSEMIENEVPKMFREFIDAIV